MTADVRIAFTDEEAGIFTAGWLEGYAEGVATTDASYQSWLGVHRPAMNLPLQDELKEARRTPPAGPCSSGRRDWDRAGRIDCPCSRCTRAVAVLSNRERYGRDDYPGSAAAAAVSAERGAA